MEYPIARTLEAFANIKIRSAFGTVESITWGTDENICAFSSFGQMWSRVWGHSYLDTNAADQIIYQEDTHVRRSE